MIAYDKFREYHGFGPWIQVVDDENALSPLFAPHCPDVDQARILIKIPRSIERRNANPDMHLYDCVFGVMADSVIILRRDGEQVIKTRIAMAEIQAIQKTNILLHGVLTLYTVNGVQRIDYNTVSDDIMIQIVAMLRSMWKNDIKSITQSSLPYDADLIDYFYAQKIRGLQKSNPDVLLLAYQPRLRLKLKDGLNLLTLFQRSRIVRCTAFLTDAQELLTIHRSKTLKPSHFDDYEYTYTYVPLNNITDVRVSPHPSISILQQFEYATKDHVFTSTFGEGSRGMEELSRTLSAL